MSQANARPLTLLAAAVGAVLLFGSVSSADAQSARDRSEQRRERGSQASSTQTAAEDTYPNATRQEPGIKASSRMSQRLQRMVDAYDGDEPEKALEIANEIMASDKANEYDKAFAAQISAQVQYDQDNAPAAIASLQKAIDYNGLDNNGHYGAMLMMAQLQLQEEQYDPALATIDRFFAETQSTKPEHLIIKGNALYRMERYPEAAVVLKQAIDASPEPRSDWQQMLMATYFETGQTAEAAALAEAVAAKAPADKRAQLNLAATYQQGEQFDKAAEVLERLRASGQLTTDQDYRSLYSTYLNMDGAEAKAAGVIQEGFQKGVLEDNFQNNLALAQTLYFSDQVAPAIDAYKKAAPLDDDGETYLNLARILWQEDRIPEAKEAARQAKAKGVRNDKDANTILALPGG